MSNTMDKLKKLLAGGELADDGSKELAQGWLQLVAESKDMQALLQNGAFKSVLTQLEKDFIARMQKIVSGDAELSAIKRMFVRTVGLQDADRRIDRLVVEFLEEPPEELK